MENIIDEANRCLSCKVRPCSKACPLGNDIPSFIKQVKENNLEEAFKILTQTTVLGAICGIVSVYQIVMIIFFCQDSAEGENRYGASPKYEEEPPCVPPEERKE